MFSIRAVLAAGCVAALFALPQAGVAADVPAAASPPETVRAASAVPAPVAARPRIALVLSGGGARGLAHIGVLKVLQEPEVREKFQTFAFEPLSWPVEEIQKQAAIKSEQYKLLIQKANISLD